jgi:Cu(I)/Ag(I) efflux system periplasmic protein CusF
MATTMKGILMPRVFAAVLVGLALVLPAVHAEESHHKPAGSKPGAMLVDGEVRRVDRDAKKITIRHGPLPQLDMPQPMTMVYQVRDAALLDKAKPGDKVKFEAEKIGGAFVVTTIEPAR